MNDSALAAITIEADLLPRFDEILTADALDFVAELTRRFGRRRRELLQARTERYAAGRSPGPELGFPGRHGQDQERPEAGGWRRPLPAWRTGVAR